VITLRRLYQINSSRIFQHIRLNRGISRIAVASDLDLDRSTITKVVRQLMEDGLVLTTGKYHGKPGVGRMATGLEINPNFGLVLGIEVQAEFCRAVLVNLDGQVFRSTRRDYPEGPQGVEERVVDLIEAAERDAAKLGLPLIGIGVGLSGIVDPYRGEILFSNPLGVHAPIPLAARVAERTRIPLLVENDANCCCWSEMAFRRATHGRNFISVLGEFRDIDIVEHRRRGVAVGLGIVIRDNVLHGDNFTAGEFRSLLYDPDRPSNTQFSITNEESYRLPDDGETLRRVIDELAFNLSLLVNSLDITKIVVAGDFSRFPAEIEPAFRRAIERNWLYQHWDEYARDYPPIRKSCAVEFSPDGENSVCIGAAAFFIQKLFSVPGMTDHVDEAVGFILLERVLALRNSAKA